MAWQQNLAKAMANPRKLQQHDTSKNKSYFGCLPKGRC